MSEAAVCAIIGCILGTAWFGTLRINTRLYLAGGALWRPVLLQLLRLAAVGATFTALARQDALAVLMALAGFLAARAAAVHRHGVRAG